MTDNISGPDGPKQQPTFDASALEKGDVISVVALEAHTGYYRSDAKYSLAVAKLVANIRFRRPDLAAHLKICQGCIVVMNDEEAEEYTQKRYDEYKAGMIRTVRRRLSIDTTQLSSESRAVMALNDQHNTAELLEIHRREKQRRREVKALKEKV